VPTDFYRIPSQEYPSLNNAMGMLGGLTAALFSVASGIGILGALFAVTVGMLVGGYIGKKQLEQEQLDGKVVGPPSRWNMEVLNNALSWSTIVTIPALVTGLFVPITGAAAGAVLFGAATMAIIGAIRGSSQGYERMTEEYELGRMLHEQKMGKSNVALTIICDHDEVPSKHSFVEKELQRREQHAQEAHVTNII
jgi:hypothetical protein